MSEKKLVVMRGVPGSGKSTKAEEIMEQAWNDGYMAVNIHSADNYFVRPDGVYDFNFRVLKNAHKWCCESVEQSMQEIGPFDGAVNYGPADLIIVDNTNTRKWEYQTYLDMAEKYGYDVEEIIVGEFNEVSVRKYAERNTHGVPVEKVVEMAGRFEK